MLDASLTHSSSASCDDDDGGGGSSLNVGVGVDDDATAEAVVSGVTGRDVSSVAFDVSGVTVDVAALPDFCLVRDDRGKSGSDSDSSNSIAKPQLRRFHAAIFDSLEMPEEKKELDQLLVPKYFPLRPTDGRSLKYP